MSGVRRGYGGGYNNEIKSLEMEIKALQPSDPVFLDKNIIQAYHTKIDDFKTRYPNSVVVWLIQGMLLEKLARYAKAREIYQKAVVIFPNNCRLLQYQAHLLLRMHRTHDCGLVVDRLLNDKHIARSSHDVININKLKSQLDEALQQQDQDKKLAHNPEHISTTAELYRATFGGIAALRKIGNPAPVVKKSKRGGSSVQIYRPPAVLEGEAAVQTPSATPARGR